MLPALELQNKFQIIFNRFQKAMNKTEILLSFYNDLFEVIRLGAFKDKLINDDLSRLR